MFIRFERAFAPTIRRSFRFLIGATAACIAVWSGATSTAVAFNDQNQQPNQPTQAPGGKVQLDPETQKKIDEMLAAEAAKKAEEEKNAANPEDKAAARKGARSRTPARPATPTINPMSPPNTGVDPAALNPNLNPIPTGDAGPSATINIPPDLDGDNQGPPELRKYSFSIKDGTYEQLIEGIAHQTGLGVLGDVPKDGRVTFITDIPLSFDEMMDQVRTLFFNYKPLDPYTIYRTQAGLKVIRVNDYYRVIPQNRMFRSVEQFRAANIPANELVFVVFTPASGAISDLRPLRDFMPDYFRVAPMETENAVSLYGQASDIEKYMDLVAFFTGENKNDPRSLERIPVVNVLPSEAMNRLNSLMDLTGQVKAAGAGRPPRGTVPDALDTMPPPAVAVIPDDMAGVLIVRAMQDKIAEIKRLLPYIDVSTSTAHVPTIIPVKHADPNTLLTTIQQILSVTDSATAAGVPAAVPPAGAARGAAGRKKAARPAVPVSTDTITLFVHPGGNALIAIGSEEEVAHVQKLVEKFDVSDVVGPLRVPLQHRHAVEMTTVLNNILSGATTKVPGMGGPTFIADNSGTSFWFIGSEKDLSRTRELLKELDVEVGDAPSMHIVRLQYQKASFVANMLREFDGADPVAAAAMTPGAAPKPRGKRKTAPTAASKFTADDELNRLYIFCTADEWVDYEKFIKQLDVPVTNERDFERLELANIPTAEAIDQLRSIVGEEGPQGAIQYVASGRSILVFGATESDLRRMKTLLAEFDRPVEIEQRTFVIKYADPAALISIIEKLVTGESSEPAQPRRRASRRAGAPEPAPAASVVSTSTGELTIIPHGNLLIVRTSPNKMRQVADIIAEFDVLSDKPIMWVYDDFRPTADIMTITDTLESILGGSAPARRGAPKEEGKPGVAPPRFIPQPSLHRLVVLASPEQFTEIEELLTVLRTSADVEIPEVAFIDLVHAAADKLITDIEPILSLRIQRLVMSGELPEAPKDEPPAPAVAPSTAKSRRTAKPKPVVAQDSGSQRYHLAPALGNKRVVVVAIPKVIEEVRSLVQKFDVPSGDAPVMRTVELVYANNIDMAKAIRELMGSTPRVVSTKDGGREAPATSRIRGADEVLSIVEQPSGNGLVLYGPMADVEQAITWIQDLDARAAQGRLIKVYRFDRADVEGVLDLVMNVVDVTPQPAPTPRRQPAKSGRAAPEEEEESDSSFATSKTRVGVDLYVKADLIDNTMLVAATPAKIAQIDALVEQIEPNEESQEPGIDLEKKNIPKLIYPLEFADGFDASFALEGALKLYWDDPRKVPDVDYEKLGDTHVLVVKHPDKDRFPEIEELIRKFADKLPEEDTRKARKVIAVPAGINAREAAERLMNSFPDVNVELRDISKPEDYGVERVGPPPKAEKEKAGKTTAPAANPCALPLNFQRSILSLSLALADPDEEDPPADDGEGEIDAAEQERIMREMGRALLAQQDEKAAPARPAEKKSEDKEEPKRAKVKTEEPVKISFDPEAGVIIMEGPNALVKEGEKVVDDMGKEVEDVTPKPDIRIFRVRYIDLETAANIIEEMFNTPRQQQAQMQAALRMQQQMAAAAAQQQAAQQAARQGQPGQPGQPQGRGGVPGMPGVQGDEAGAAGRGGRAGQPNIQQIPGLPQMPTTAVRVYPNPRDRTLIFRADTNQYPAIMELLATIDQPQPINARLKVFPLEKLNATEVEAVLKEMLGLDGGRGGRSQARRQVPGGEGGVVGGGPSVASSSQLPEQIMNETVAGMLGIDTSHIKISSNAESNTILAMAPEAALDYIGNIIHELESHEAPSRAMEHFYLTHADPSDVADFLTTHFEESTTQGRLRRGDRGTGGATVGKSLNTPTFTPYPRLNLLSAQATETQMVEVRAMVAELDVPSKSEELHSVTLVHADAKQTADTLTALFGGSGGGGGAPRRGPGGGGAASAGGAGPRFIGNEGEAIVFFSAPVGMHEVIRAKIKQLDDEAGVRSRPREIVLEVATPSKVADAIETAYGSGRTQAGRGAPGGRTKTRFSLSAHDPSKRLFVVSDDAMFQEIAALARTLDRDDGVINAKLRIYPLKYAGSKELLGKLNKMITDYVSRMSPEQRGQLDAFSVEADEKTNSLVVLGSPAIFGFVEQSLHLIDTPANAVSGPGSLSVTLENSDATEVVQNLKNMFAGRQLAPGESAPQIEANKTGNRIIAKGTQGQMDEIRKFVEQLDTVDPNARKVEVVAIRNADAASVSRALNEIYVRSAPQRAGVPAISISEIPGSRAVLVKAAPADLEKIKVTVTELDSEKYSGGSEVRVVPLRFADATELQTAAQAILTKPGAGGRGAELMGGVRVGILASSNAVVLSGERAALDSLETEITRLDQQAGEQGVKPVLITLSKAPVSKVMPMLEQMYGPSAQRGRSTQQPPVFVANPAINGILVQASPRDMSGIRATIEAMDIDAVAAAPDFRIVQVAPGIPVVQLADKVQATVNESALANAGAGGRGDIASVTLTPDQRSNSIIIGGSAQLFDQAERMIKMLEGMGPSGQVVTAIYRPTNTRIEDLQRLIEELKNRAAGEGSSGRTGGTRGSRPTPQPPRRR